MTFTAKILSWHFRHLNIVGCLLKKKAYQGGGHGYPRTPPSYAPVNKSQVLIHINKAYIFGPSTYKHRILSG